MRAQPYDAIVIGSGATGGWAAKELTAAGLRVMVIEAGPRAVALSGSTPPTASERELLDRQPIQQTVSRYYHPSLFVDDIDHPYTTPRGRPYRWIRSRVFGGRTMSWNGITLRMSDLDFRARDHDGIGHNWPISYQELAPYYDRAELWLGVSGGRDRLAHLPEGCFLPPRRMTAGERRFKRCVEHRWRDRPVIIQRGVLPGDRWTSPTSTLATARRTGRLTVRTDAIVSHLVIDPKTARARGVACIDRVSREAFEVRGRVIMLCASTIETLRILLATERIRDTSEALGRYLMDHTMISAVGTMPSRSKRCATQARGPYGIYVPRFRNLGTPSPSFVRGYGIQGFVQRDPVETPTRDGVPFQLIAFGEVLARRDNRITLDPGTRDAWGIPVPRIACRYGANENAMAVDQTEFFSELFAACNAESTSDLYWPIPGTSIHECGGARMGVDARTSVVDRLNRCWAAPNVVVSDGACFVSSSCQNPTLTMIALTIRACAHLVEDLKARRL